jgi:hypothetical protein
VAGALVLILAGDWDPLALAVRDELERRGREHAMLSTDWFRHSELEWTPVPFGGSMKLGGRRVELGSLTGVLARHDVLVELPGTLEPSGDRYPFYESAAALLALLDALPCPVVNRPKPVPRTRVTMLSPALARAAGFEPVPTLVASSRDEALAALAPDGTPTLVGRVSASFDDRVVTTQASGAAAIDALLPHGAVVIKTLTPATLVAAFVAGDTVVGAAWSEDAGALEQVDLDPTAARAARAIAERLGVQLLRVAFQQSDGRLWLVDIDANTFVPGGIDRNLVAPAATGLADLLGMPAR